MQTSARTTADNSFSTQVESGVCDIQYIFCDNVVSAVVMMCDLTLSDIRQVDYTTKSHTECTHIDLLVY